MSFNNVVPGFILRDPEKLASFLKSMEQAVEEPTLPGMEDWVPEDESVNEEYPEDYTVYRVVNSQGKQQWSGTAARFRKPYYTSLRGARGALSWFPGNSRIQKGTVKWEELEE